MPVTVEQLSLDNPEHYADLVKIYSESPGWMVRDLSAEDFIAQYLQPCDSVWGGWFNGRILGAVGVKTSRDGLQLIGLGVRKTTRRRGVAGRMMELVLAEIDRPVYIDTRQQPTTDGLFDKLGFIKGVPEARDNASWVRWVKPQ